jgi:hypothetical protein
MSQSGIRNDGRADEAGWTALSYSRDDDFAAAQPKLMQIPAVGWRQAWLSYRHDQPPHRLLC